MALWLPRIIWRMVKNADTYFPSRQGIVVVHGDTFSTLAGGLVGKLLGMRVAHVEAGLRSYNIFHPFPEELTRLAVFRLSDIAFCPGEWAMRNMEGYRCERINTGMNTIVDAVRMATANSAATPSKDSYGVISIHRFENIFLTKGFGKLWKCWNMPPANAALFLCCTRRLKSVCATPGYLSGWNKTQTFN